jgi:type IV secretion system protein VirB2
MHHPHRLTVRRASLSLSVLLVALTLCAPELCLAQASPFMTGASALQTNVLAWLTPIAIILIMVLGGMAMANRMSWGWCLGAILGIAIAFGAPQIVTWVRGMFGV